MKLLNKQLKKMQRTRSLRKKKNLFSQPAPGICKGCHLWGDGLYNCIQPVAKCVLTLRRQKPPAKQHLGWRYQSIQSDAAGSYQQPTLPMSLLVLKKFLSNTPQHLLYACMPVTHSHTPTHTHLLTFKYTIGTL